MVMSRIRAMLGKKFLVFMMTFSLFSLFCFP